MTTPASYAKRVLEAELENIEYALREETAKQNTSNLIISDLTRKKQDLRRILSTIRESEVPQ